MMDDTFEGGDGSVMIDMTEVEEASNELLPRATYDCIIEECEYKLSQNSGQPMWSCKLNISDGEYAGRKLFTNISFSPKALPYTKKTLMAIAPELLSGPFNPEDVASDMEGKAVKAVTKIGKDLEGNDRTEVKSLKAAGEAEAFMNG